jgi:hypothetical protein
MMRLSLHIALAAAAACSSASAGETRMYKGQSDLYAIEFLDPVDFPNSMIEISAYVQDDLAYTKKLASVPFKSECRVSANEISCARSGRSPMAGATYRRTRDGTPRCPGQAEDRFTCVNGCGPIVPRYITFSISEC